MKIIRYILILFCALFCSAGYAAGKVEIKQVAVKKIDMSGSPAINVRVDYKVSDKKMVYLYFYLWFKDGATGKLLPVNGNATTKQNNRYYRVERCDYFKKRPDEESFQFILPVSELNLKDINAPLQLAVTASSEIVADEKKRALASTFPFKVDLNQSYSYLDAYNPITFEAPVRTNQATVATTNTTKASASAPAATQSKPATQAPPKTRVEIVGVDLDVACPDGSKGLKVNSYTKIVGKKGKRCRVQYYFKDTDTGEWVNLGSISYARSNVDKSLRSYFYSNVTPTADNYEFHDERYFPYNFICHHNGRNNYQLYVAISDENDKELCMDPRRKFSVNQRGSYAVTPHNPYDWDYPHKYDKPAAKSSSSSSSSTSTASTKKASTTTSSTASKTSASSDPNIVSKVRKDTGSNKYSIITTYANGVKKYENYGLCASCLGSGKCATCGGRGYLGGMACLFGTSGVCNLCQGKGESWLSTTYYDKNGNQVSSSSIYEGIEYNNPSDDGLRYPENQKYEERGTWSDRKYKEEKRTSCKYCGGSGIHPTPESSNPGSRIAVYHNTGKKCATCGRVTIHYHRLCPHCR